MMKSLAAAAAFAVLLAGPAGAADQLGCFEQSAVKYRINPDLLRLIAKHESGQHLSATHINKNHTEDVCAMQINSSWFPKIRAFGITREILLTDACVCIDTGAWILAQTIQMYGYNWRAVAAYRNPKHPDKEADYARTILSQRYVYDQLLP